MAGPSWRSCAAIARCSFAVPIDRVISADTRRLFAGASCRSGGTRGCGVREIIDLRLVRLDSARRKDPQRSPTPPADTEKMSVLKSTCSRK